MTAIYIVFRTEKLMFAKTFEVTPRSHCTKYHIITQNITHKHILQTEEARTGSSKSEHVMKT